MGTKFLKSVMSILKDKWIDLLALIFAVLAFLVALGSNQIAIDANTISRQANEIASKGGESDIEIISAQFLNAKIDENPKHSIKSHFCNHVLRITNHGGANTAILNYVVTVSYKDSSINLYNSGQAAAIMQTSAELVVDGSIRSLLLESRPPILEETIEDSTLKWLQMPAPIQSHETIDFYVQISFDQFWNWFRVNSLKLNTSMGIKLIALKGDPSTELGAMVDALEPSHNNPQRTPIEISYTVISSDGQSSSSKKLPCIWTIPDGG